MLEEKEHLLDQLINTLFINLLSEMLKYEPLNVNTFERVLYSSNTYHKDETRGEEGTSFCA